MEEWYRSQNMAVQAQFDYVLRVLEVTEDIQEWEEKKRFKVFTERHIGLCEIKFTVQERGRARKFRPLGFWHPGHNEFVLVMGLEKVGRNYIPPTAFDFALDAQLNFFRDGSGTLYEHTIYPVG